MPRGHKKDFPATLARKFKDKDSFISTDGLEFLYRKDWKARVRQCFDRDGYKCQWIIASGVCPTFPLAPVIMEVLCSAPAHHPHHKIPKGKGGSDDLDNLMAICIQHHRIAHPEKQTRWSKNERMA